MERRQRLVKRRLEGVDAKHRDTKERFAEVLSTAEEMGIEIRNIALDYY